METHASYYNRLVKVLRTKFRLVRFITDLTYSRVPVIIALFGQDFDGRSESWINRLIPGFTKRIERMTR